MRITCLIILASWTAVVPAAMAADTLVVPFVAYDAEGRDDSLWSSELYLTNPTSQPVQVSVLDFLPGVLVRSRPCDLPTASTRVVPPMSAVVWTASGLATDLGCADHAVGSLLLDVDGPILVTSRTVNHPADTDHRRRGLLAGAGQEIDAISLARLPAPGQHLLSSLLWHRNPCGPSQFDTYLGFANPDDRATTVIIDVPAAGAAGEVLIDDVTVELPHAIRIPARAWSQVHLAPASDPAASCLGPSSFFAVLTTEAPLAVYASVVSRDSSDPRTVLPIPID